MFVLVKNIRLIRKELKYTQLMMAKVLKIGFRTYVRYESGKREIPAVILIKLARLGGVSLEQILNREISSYDILPCLKTPRREAFTKLKFVDFSNGRIVFENPARSELITLDSSEKKILTIFRKMDADLKGAYIQSL